MVILQVYYVDQKQMEDLLLHLHQKFPQITSLQYVINPKGNDTFHDLEVICFKGKPYITEQMEGLQFRVGPKSFYQTNTLQAYELYKITREFANLQGNEVVYDLYTGTGTIANFIARRARKVVGLEYIATAIEDAKINSNINHIGNTAFFAGDIKHLLTKQLLKSKVNQT
jgi:23S rRNA (uracil1939-C5)-methyltransferase